MTDGGINTEKKEWVNLGYFPYEIMRKKWQYHLLGMVKEHFGDSIKDCVDLLWKNYPEGFVGHVSKARHRSTHKDWQNILQNMWHSHRYLYRRLIKYSGNFMALPEFPGYVQIYLMQNISYPLRSSDIL